MSNRLPSWPYVTWIRHCRRPPTRVSSPESRTTRDQGALLGPVPALRTLRVCLVAGALIGAAVLFAGCSKSIEESPGYRAACHGPPLRSAEKRNEAMENGYSIHPEYHCVERASYADIERQRAEWKTANSPEAIAAREADFRAQRQREQAERARRAHTDVAPSTASTPTVELREVDVNSASTAQIASVISIGGDLAERIVEERSKRPFTDWADLVVRVDGLRAARSAAEASMCGLTVNGHSLEGAPPDPTMAALIQRKYRSR